MFSRIPSFIVSSLVVVTLGLVGCAGSKSSGSSGGGSSMGSGVDEKSQRLEDARKNAEDAEMKAHQLREEKFRKSSSN